MRTMRTRASLVVLLVALIVVGAACGDTSGESPTAESTTLAAGGFDCDTIEWVVPYAPGGGSDQQMRRLLPFVEEALGATVHPVYRTGGAAAVGWQSVADAEPDGCTVGTAVYPEIVLQTIGLPEEDTGFRVDSFTWITWTEAAPNALFVEIDSEFADIEALLEQARAKPGGLTIGATAGAAGELVANQIQEATGTELTFVGIDGGVGEIVPLLMGSHMDMGVGGAHHVVEAFLESARALAVAGSVRVPALPDVPTFEELGYPGVTVATVWGVIGPAGMSEEAVTIWSEALRAAGEAVAPELVDMGLTSLNLTPADALEYTQTGYEDLSAVIEASE